ncbi:hypothetical protein D3C74_50460 [compost metagenome]
MENSFNYRIGDPVLYKGEPWRVYWNYKNGEIEIVKDDRGYGNGISVPIGELQMDRSRGNLFSEEDVGSD